MHVALPHSLPGLHVRLLANWLWLLMYLAIFNKKSLLQWLHLAVQENDHAMVSQACRQVTITTSQ